MKLTTSLVYVTNSLLLCAALLTVSGCQQTLGNGFGGLEVERRLFPHAYGLNSGQIVSASTTELMSATPFQVGVTVAVQLANSDPRVLEQAIRKYELDFGTGAGWQDVTSEALQWDLDDRDGYNLDNFSQYAYTTAGSYAIGSRVTYWDGEVITGRPIQITVN